jgi:hypothetical protein
MRACVRQGRRDLGTDLEAVPCGGSRLNLENGERPTCVNWAEDRTWGGGAECRAFDNGENAVVLVQPDEVEREPHTSHPDRVFADCGPQEKESVQVEAIVPAQSGGAPFCSSGDFNVESATSRNGQRGELSSL